MGCNCCTTRESGRSWGQETTALWWRIKWLLMTTHQTSFPAHTWTYNYNFYNERIMARGINRLRFFQQENLLDAWLTRICSMGKIHILKCSGSQSWYLQCLLSNIKLLGWINQVNKNEETVISGVLLHSNAGQAEKVKKCRVSRWVPENKTAKDACKIN